jgi:hypothetical protein
LLWEFRKNEWGMTLDGDFWRLVTARIYDHGGRHQWKAWYNFKVQEPIFREYLRRMDHVELSSMARDYAFLCQTSIDGPWKIDLFKTNLIKEEFARRGKPEVFEVVQNSILNFLKR